MPSQLAAFAATSVAAGLVGLWHAASAQAVVDGAAVGSELALAVAVVVEVVAEQAVDSAGQVTLVHQWVRSSAKVASSDLAGPVEAVGLEGRAVLDCWTVTRHVA